MTDSALLFHQNGPVAWLTLNRPAAMNAISQDMIAGFAEHLPRIAADPEIRVLVLTGSGSAFCAGADLKQVLDGLDTPPGEPDFLDRLSDQVFDVIRNLEKPVIAALNGLTMAGGLEIAMCADIVLAADSVRIGDAHANFGVFPGGGGAALLPRILPHNVAKYLLLTGETLSAQDMKTWGFVNEVVKKDTLNDRAQALAEKIAGNSPIAMRGMKAVANQALDKSRDDALLHEQYAFRRHMRSWDFREGIAAFGEKRKPNFRGR